MGQAGSNLVPPAGLEPASLAAEDFKSSLFTNLSTGAQLDITLETGHI